MTLLIATDGVLPPLEEDLGFRVLGRCGASEALDTISLAKPDCAIVQVRDPAQILTIREASPRTKLVAVGQSRDRAFAIGVVTAGANAYLPGEPTSAHLRDGLRAVREGRIFIAPLEEDPGHVHPPPVPAPVEVQAPVIPQKMITIILADDHAIVREGLAALCSSNPRFKVIAQCADGEIALETILREKPDFAILDLHMPKLTGLEVIRRLRNQGSTAKLVVLSIGRDDTIVMEALRAGADAYLLKDGPSNHLLDAINYVSEGGVYVSPLLGGAKLFTRGDIPRAEDPLASLSPREMEVFSYLVNGLRAKDIADLLDISPKTVDTYRASLMRKLGVHELVGLVKFAIERNLTTTTSEPPPSKRTS
jgi:DNA-binding NarL/FixJ family response regulator